MDVQAGALKANPTPMQNTLTRMRQGLSRCSQPSTAMLVAAAANPKLIKHTNFCRSTLSARAPAGNVNRKKGSDATVDKREMKNGDPVETFYHPGRRTIVGGYAGSRDYRRNPEFSEYRISQGRPSGVHVAGKTCKCSNTLS